MAYPANLGNLDTKLLELDYLKAEDLLKQCGFEVQHKIEMNEQNESYCMFKVSKPRSRSKTVDTLKVNATFSRSSSETKLNEASTASTPKNETIANLLKKALDILEGDRNQSFERTFTKDERISPISGETDAPNVTLILPKSGPVLKNTPTVKSNLQANAQSRLSKAFSAGNLPEKKSQISTGVSASPALRSKVPAGNILRRGIPMGISRVKPIIKK